VGDVSIKLLKLQSGKSVREKNKGGEGHFGKRETKKNGKNQKRKKVPSGKLLMENVRDW